MSTSDPSPQPDRDEQRTEDEKSALRRRQGMAYQGALEAVFAILISAGIGYGVDQYFGSSPFGLFVGFVIGFAAFVLRLVRLGKVLNETDDAPPPRPRAQ